MPEIRKPNVIQPNLFDNLIVQPMHHLRRVEPLGSRVHEHERTSWMFGVFQAQEFKRF